MIRNTPVLTFVHWAYGYLDRQGRRWCGHSMLETLWGIEPPFPNKISLGFSTRSNPDDVLIESQGTWDDEPTADGKHSYLPYRIRGVVREFAAKGHTRVYMALYDRTEG